MDSRLGVDYIRHSELVDVPIGGLMDVLASVLTNVHDSELIEFLGSELI